MIKVDENFNYNDKAKKKIAGKEGWFVEKYDLIDKYMRRDGKCDELVMEFLTMKKLAKILMKWVNITIHSMNKRWRTVRKKIC